MRTCLLIWVLGSVSTVSAGPLQTGDELLASRKAAIEKWIAASDFSHSFQILRIGRDPHPDPAFAVQGPKILHLELQFVDEDSSDAEQPAHFQQLLAAYQAKHGATLAEKFFYEFIHVFAIGRREACVDFHLLEEQYSVYVSPKSSELIVRRDESRSPTAHFSVTIPVLGSTERFRVHSAEAAAADAQGIRASVESIIKKYFQDASQRKGLPAPEIITERGDDYLDFSIPTVKGLVTDGYWEWVSIDIIFHPDNAPSASQPTVWSFGCNVNVKYASSRNETSPYDADNGDFAGRMVDFRKRLVDELQHKLEKRNQ